MAWALNSAHQHTRIQGKRIQVQHIHAHVPAGTAPWAERDPKCDASIMVGKMLKSGFGGNPGGLGDMTGRRTARGPDRQSLCDLFRLFSRQRQAIFILDGLTDATIGQRKPVDD